MDLLHFKMRLADNLINLGRSDNIKRPRGRSNNASPPPKKKMTKESRPYQETRCNIGHLPTYGEKCNIHLCFVVNSKNCFATFHKKKNK